jgi:hypothetical protein
MNLSPHNDSQKENIAPSENDTTPFNSPFIDSPLASLFPSPLPTPNYTSNASQTANGQRKALTDLQPRVTDGSEASMMGDDRPLTVTLPIKRTRFHSPLATQQNMSAPRVTSQAMEANPPSQAVNYTNRQTLSAATNQVKKGNPVPQV